MTKGVLQKFQKVRTDRLGKNDARRIRAERDKARSSTSAAPRRWAFELLQNAHDPGPRKGAEYVDVEFRGGATVLRFRHNGRPFELDDLAALLSGGSSKEYESKETTGRYGTGFLVTHVLSTKFGLTGVLQDELRLERFAIELDRSGDEDSIRDNAGEADAGLERAVPVDVLTDDWTAEFQFAVDNPQALIVGLDGVRDAAPYLLGTCEHLGSIVIELPSGDVETWKVINRARNVDEGMQVLEHEVQCTRGGSLVLYRVFRLVPPSHPGCGLVVVLNKEEQGWRLAKPNVESPKIFGRLPVRLSTFLAINCVVDGRFDVQEERDRIAMSDTDKKLLSAALALLPLAVSKGVKERWESAHLLGCVGKITSAFSENTTEAELSWWNECLGSVAQELARLDVVHAVDGRRAAARVEGVRHADFVLPRHNSTTSADEISLDRVWQLAANTTFLFPPTGALSADWNEISKGWGDLGVPVARWGLRELASGVRTKDRMLKSMPVKAEPVKWLAAFFDLLGTLPAHYDGVQLTEGLMPNQLGELCSPTDLLRDAAIPERLKDIAESLGHPARKRLLERSLEKLGAGDGFAALPAFLQKAVQKSLTEPQLVDECVNVLLKALPDGTKADKNGMSLIAVSIELLVYLWDSRGTDAASLAHRCPLLARDGAIAHHTAKRIMAPISSWDEPAKPFGNLYLPGRVLSDLYVTSAPSGANLISALSQWEMCFPGPLHRGRRAEVDEALLKELIVGDVEVAGLTVRNEMFSQVALLSTEVLQRCEEDPRLASLLLEFVLLYLAPNDASWKTQRTVKAKSKERELDVVVRDALWVGELKRRAWVPVDDADNMRPSAASLSPLLKTEWLAKNDDAVAFLVQCFQFDVLSLRLQSLPGPSKTVISERLAQLVDLGGADTSFYEQIVDAVETQRQRQREKDRNRKLGLAIQQAIQDYLSALGLEVTVIDRGYDFDVEVPAGVPLIETGTHELSVGPYLVEVKATTSGAVRLTPAQARTASGSDRFALCVVDLRECPAGRLEEPWSTQDVEGLARITDTLRPGISQTHSLVEAAADQAIGIQNEGKLRYAVPADIWGKGQPIVEWVRSIVPNLSPKK